MKAIETIYRGYKFRSRLEARWAVFFDTLGVQWKYEAEGYEREYGNGKRIRYLPDFQLPSGPGEDCLFIEVKGDPDYYNENGDKFIATHDYGGILPGFNGSYKTNRGIILLGQIPEPLEGVVYLHPIIQHNEGLFRRWAMFIPPEGPNPCIYIFNDTPRNLFYAMCGVRGEQCVTDGQFLDTTPIAIKVQRSFYPVYNAYQAARQARFEFGGR